MFECPNCGGHVVFDPKLQKMRCEFCDSVFDPTPEDLAEQSGDAGNVLVHEATDQYETNVFTCPQCGGEILSDDATAVTFCSFCGASTVLEGRLAKIKKPDYIIPFTKTKEDAQKEYEKVIRRSLFAPSAMKRDTVVERFRGIYMPYWVYDFKIDGDVMVEGQVDHRRGDYIYHDHYNIQSELHAHYDGVSFDASSSFSDTLSGAIAPYDCKQKKDFSKEYFAGFYGDTSDIPMSVYKSTARNIVKADAAGRLIKSGDYRRYGATAYNAMGAVTPDEESGAIGYFPVWFLANRNGERVSYAVVNGQTGKVAVDVPISYGKYLIGVLILALPIFFLLNFFATITPGVAIGITMVLAIISAILNGVLQRKIFIRENYLDDAGMQNLAKKEAARAKRAAQREADAQGGNVPPMPDEDMDDMEETTVAPSRSVAGTIGLIACVLLGVILVFYMGFVGALVAAGIYHMGHMVSEKNVKVVTEAPRPSTPFSQFFGSIWKPLLGIVVGLVILVWSPVSDLYYYGAGVICMCLVGWSFYDVVMRHNRFTTRPLPQFNKRGGDK